MALPNKPNPSNYLRHYHLALQMLLAMGIAGWLGYQLDNYLQFSIPIFMLVFGFVAFGGTLFQVYRSLKKE